MSEDGLCRFEEQQRDSSSIVEELDSNTLDKLLAHEFEKDGNTSHMLYMIFQNNMLEDSNT